MTGTWKIDRRYIVKQWRGFDFSLFTQICIEETSKGPLKFDLEAIEGVVRFQRQVTHKNTKPTSKTKAGIERRREDNFDEEGEETNGYGGFDGQLDYQDDKRRSPTPEVFCFGLTSEPPAEHLT